MKRGLSVALTLLFCVPYFTLQRAPVFPVRTFESRWLDDYAGFEPGWVWVYQSAYLFIAAVPWLITSREALLRYARGFTLLSVVGFVMFLLLPIRGPRPGVVPTDGMFGLLVSYDGTLNSFPSLHAGLMVYTLLVAAGLAAPVRGSRRILLIGAGVGWALAVFYSTLATKQHFAVDLPPGAALAWLAHRWAWRRERPAPLTASPGAAWIAWSGRR